MLGKNEEVQKKIERALDMFDTSFLYKEGKELILHKEWNIYIQLSNVYTPEDFDYKIISYLSFYTADNHFGRTGTVCKWAWNRLNRWFRKDFTYEELQIIYEEIGTGQNRKKGIEFIKSGLNMDVLK